MFFVFVAGFGTSTASADSALFFLKRALDMKRTASPFRTRGRIGLVPRCCPHRRSPSCCRPRYTRASPRGMPDPLLVCFVHPLQSYENSARRADGRGKTWNGDKKNALSFPRCRRVHRHSHRSGRPAAPERDVVGPGALCRQRGRRRANAAGQGETNSLSRAFAFFVRSLGMYLHYFVRAASMGAPAPLYSSYIPFTGPSASSTCDDRSSSWTLRRAAAA